MHGRDQKGFRPLLFKAAPTEAVWHHLSHLLEPDYGGFSLT